MNVSILVCPPPGLVPRPAPTALQPLRQPPNPAPRSHATGRGRATPLPPRLRSSNAILCDPSILEVSKFIGIVKYPLPPGLALLPS